jgi:hypothetical protein
MIRFDALRTRFLADTVPGGTGATPSLTRSLERIGWRSMQDPSPAEVAGELVLLVEQCVRGHRDVQALAYAIATFFRDVGPSLDGGLPPTEAYLPAAEELLRLYVANERPSAQPSVFNPDDPC